MTKHIFYKSCVCGGKMQLWSNSKTGNFWWCYSYCGKRKAAR